MKHCPPKKKRRESDIFSPDYGAMALWLGRCIPKAGVLASKQLGGSKVDLTFHPSEVNQMIFRNSS